MQGQLESIYALFILVLKKTMKEKNISIRELSRISGISAASLSRILSGKQVCNLKQLSVLTEILEIPLEKWLFPVAAPSILGAPAEGRVLFDLLAEILKSFGHDMDSVILAIRNDLDKYHLYAKTEEGRNIILNGFYPKLKTINSSGYVVEQLENFYGLYTKKELSQDQESKVGSCLLYFILSTDVIPDYAFPIGYLDDAIALKIVSDEIFPEKNDELAKYEGLLS